MGESHKPCRRAFEGALTYQVDVLSNVTFGQGGLMRLVTILWHSLVAFEQGLITTIWYVSSCR